MTVWRAAPRARGSPRSVHPSTSAAPRVPPGRGRLKRATPASCPARPSPSPGGPCCGPCPTGNRAGNTLACAPARTTPRSADSGAGGRLGPPAVGAGPDPAPSSRRVVRPSARGRLAIRSPPPDSESRGPGGRAAAPAGERPASPDPGATGGMADHSVPLSGLLKASVRVSPASKSPPDPTGCCSSQHTASACPLWIANCCLAVLCMTIG